MFQDLEIRNFRLFKHIKLERLGQINLLAGGNNSGKTSVLEALLLLSSGGHPRLVLELNGLRLKESRLGDKLRETHFNPLFYQFDYTKSIEITSEKNSLNSMKLTIKVKRKNFDSISLNNLSSVTENKSLIPTSQSTFKANTEEMYSDLCLEYTLNRLDNELNSESEEIPKKNYLRIRNDGLSIEKDPSQEEPPVAGIFISGGAESLQEYAIALGELRRRKQSDSLVKVLKIIEPRLVDLEENSVAGYPMIWGDIGLAELVPLPMMGEGMIHVARIFLSMPKVAGGVLLIDEIENGIHYSALEKLWTAIAAAAEQAQVQVFATTHSYECMAAAHRALGKRLVFHRIDENREDRNRCVTFESEELGIAIEHGWEVR